MKLAVSHYKPKSRFFFEAMLSYLATKIESSCLHLAILLHMQQHNQYGDTFVCHKATNS